MSKKIQIIGHKFGHLTVIKEQGRDNKGIILYDCVCDCGNHSLSRSHDLRNGTASSCGCIRNQKIKNLNLTHGESKTRLYQCWRGIKNRCENKNDKWYKEYGARGIKICNEWKTSYENFRNWALSAGYTNNLTIDRIDVNGNYEPSNCKWSNMYEQANNRRNNNLVTYHGETDSLTNMCRKLNVNYTTVKARIRKGYSFEYSVDKFRNTSKFVEYWKKK